MAYVGLYFSRMFQRVFMANRLIIGQWGYVRKTDFPCILKLLGVEDDGRLACVLRSLANGVLMFVFGLQSSYKAWVTEFLQDWLTESAIPPIYSLLFSVNAIKSFFDGYGYHGTSFEQTYLCYPASYIDKPQIENGDKIIMPPSALDRLASLHIDYPMLFELHNAATERMSHCGVLEFIAEEGMIYMPYWMKENLLLQEGDIVRVKNVTLPKGTYVKLQPHTKDFLDISNPKAILETTLRNFSCLTTGDSIMVAYNNKKYYIDIIETKPSNAISIIETDCEVDFAPPLDYKEPEKPVVTVPSGKAPAGGEEVPAETEPKFNPFTGAGRRLDGKPLKYKPPPVSSSSGSKDKRPDVASGGGQPSTRSSSQGTTRQTQGKLMFGSNVNRTKEPQKQEPAKEPKQEEPSKKDEPKFQPFTGKKYSLKG